jgi:hypothetical protein
MFKLPFDKINAIADRTIKPIVPYAKAIKAAAAPAPRSVPLDIQRLIASIDKNLPLPAVGQKYSVESIDQLLVKQNLSTVQRMRLKAKLYEAGLL